VKAPGTRLMVRELGGKASLKLKTFQLLNLHVEAKFVAVHVCNTVQQLTPKSPALELSHLI